VLNRDDTDEALNREDMKLGVEKTVVGGSPCRRARYLRRLGMGGGAEKERKSRGCPRVEESGRGGDISAGTS
jgi:hypothetical protein